MSPSEYKELVDFLGRKFDVIDARFEAIDRRFDGVDKRFDAMDMRFDALETRLTRVEITVEDNRHRIQILAEGLATLDGKVDRLREEMASEFKSVREEMQRL